MNPLVVGIICGIVASAAMVVAHFKIGKPNEIYVLALVIFLSMLPRLYYTFEAPEVVGGEVMYILGWIPAALLGALGGLKYGKRLLRRNK